jgi:hypothetical protein
LASHFLVPEWADRGGPQTPAVVFAAPEIELSAFEAEYDRGLRLPALQKLLAHNLYYRR